MAWLRVDERRAIARRQGPIVKMAVIGAELRNVHLLEIAAASRCTGKSEMDLIRSAEILGDEVAGERAPEFAVNPIFQRVSVGIPGDVTLVPTSIFEVAEGKRGCERRELRASVGIDQLRRFGSEP